MNTYLACLLRTWVTFLALVLALVLAVSITGCAKIPLTSLWALRQFDLERVDPAELRVAVRLPARVEMKPEGLRVEVKFTPVANGVTATETLRFREPASPNSGAAGGAPAAVLPLGRDSGGPWIFLALDASDVQRLRQFRASLQGQGKSRVEFTAQPQWCRRGEQAESPGRLSTAVRWSPASGYVMLLADEPLQEVTKLLADPGVAPPMPVCESSA
ncbi:hypothetical protein BH11PSE8_BH11PSE8_37700 [soil metagenome]